MEVNSNRVIVSTRPGFDFAKEKVEFVEDLGGGGSGATVRKAVVNGKGVCAVKTISLKGKITDEDVLLVEQLIRNQDPVGGDSGVEGEGSDDEDGLDALGFGLGGNSSRSSLLRFAQEVRLLSLLNHENVVTFLGQTFVGQELRLFMRYHPTSLAGLCKSSRMQSPNNSRGSVAPDGTLSIPLSSTMSISGGDLTANSHSNATSTTNSTLSNSSMDVEKPMLTTWSHEKCKSLLLGISRGLAYLHRQTPPVVHRDVKPDNVVVTLNEDETLFESVQLVDFDWSKEMEHDSMFTMVGTSPYTAPEVYAITGYTEKADVWSFGMLILEVLTLKRPYFESRSTDIPALVTGGVFPQLPGPMIEKYKEKIQASKKRIMHSPGRRARSRSRTYARLDQLELAPELVPFLHLLLWCLDFDPTTRPSIFQVVAVLESSNFAKLGQPKAPVLQMNRPFSRGASEMQFYEILNRIGQGKFGQVFLANDKRTNTKVAMKMVDKLQFTDPAEKRFLMREVRIMQLLRHPHIITLLGVIDAPDKMSLVMEVAQGGTVQDYIIDHAKEGLDEIKAGEWFVQLVSALQYCHENHVVHRDLKLENVLLDENHKNIKLIDFGLSNTFRTNQGLETFCGSPLYTAPEVLQRKSYQGPKGDVWSIGVILYALVSGRMPFSGKNLRSLYMRILSGKYRVLADKSEELLDLLSGMLVVNPAARCSLDQVAKHPWVVKRAKQSGLEGLLGIKGGGVGGDLLATEVPVHTRDRVVDAVCKMFGFEREDVLVAISGKLDEFPGVPSANRDFAYSIHPEQVTMAAAYFLLLHNLSRLDQLQGENVVDFSEYQPFTTSDAILLEEMERLKMVGVNLPPSKRLLNMFTKSNVYRWSDWVKGAAVILEVPEALVQEIKRVIVNRHGEVTLSEVEKFIEWFGQEIDAPLDQPQGTRMDDYEMDYEVQTSDYQTDAPEETGTRLDQVLAVTRLQSFKAWVSGKEAESKLRGHAAGTFLVRFSRTRAKSYAISVICADGKTRHWCATAENKQYVLCGRIFPNLHALLMAHSVSPLVDKNGKGVTKLLYALK